jgi:hypothetical protein
VSENCLLPRNEASVFESETTNWPSKPDTGTSGRPSPALTPEDALDQLTWRQTHAPEGIQHRLEVVTTTITITHEYHESQQ